MDIDVLLSPETEQDIQTAMDEDLRELRKGLIKMIAIAHNQIDMAKNGPGMSAEKYADSILLVREQLVDIDHLIARRAEARRTKLS